MNKTNILIAICARGGSKGVKNKNIREIAGKPLIVYTIETAKKWGKAARIICSTDSEEIAKIAKDNGIEVPFIRPEELAADTSGKPDVLRHALKECEKIFNEKYDIVIDLDVTNPIRTTKDLDSCLQIFNEKNPDVLFSVVEARKNPYFNVVEINKNGFAELSKKPEKLFLRRQDTPKVYDMNTSIYFYAREFLMNAENISPFSAKKTAVYVMDDVSAFDIDSERDLKYIEYLIKSGEVQL